MATKKKIVVTLEEGRVKSALLSGAELLESAAAVKTVDADEAVKAAREDLKPTIEQAAKLAAELAEMRAAHGEELERLSGINWPQVRAAHHRIPLDLIHRLMKLVFEARTLLDGAARELAEVPDRVRKLRPEDLQLRIFPAKWGMPAGEWPVEPHRIRIDVQIQTTAAETVRGRIKEIEYVLSQIEARIQTSPGTEGRLWKPARPEDNPPPAELAAADINY